MSISERDITLSKPDRSLASFNYLMKQHILKDIEFAFQGEALYDLPDHQILVRFWVLPGDQPGFSAEVVFVKHHCDRLWFRPPYITSIFSKLNSFITLRSRTSTNRRQFDQKRRRKTRGQSTPAYWAVKEGVGINAHSRAYFLRKSLQAKSEENVWQFYNIFREVEALNSETVCYCQNRNSTLNSTYLGSNLNSVFETLISLME